MTAILSLGAWLCLVPAADAAPVLGAHGLEASGHGPDGVPLWLGGGFTGGFTWRDRLGIELVGEGGGRLDGQPFVSFRPQARLFVGPTANATATRVALVAGGGVSRDGAWGPVASGGLGLDLPAAGSLRPRMQALYLGGVGVPSRLQVSAHLVWERRTDAVIEPVAEPVAAPMPTFEPVTLPKGTAMVWVARPTCEWLPAEEARPLLRARLGEAKLATLADPWLREPVVSGAEGAALELPDDHGDLVVVALPGDEVTVDGEAVAVAASGLAAWSRPEGFVDVRVVGAGRDVQLEVGITAEATVWLQVDGEPELERHIGFLSGKSVLRPEAATVVADLGRSLGAWRIELRGGYSPEGSLEANEALAQGRAEAVRGELLAAGVPEDRISVVPPEPPDAEQTADEQRAVHMTLLPVEVSR